MPAPDGRRWLVLLLGSSAVLGTAALMAPAQTTYAAYSDVATVPVRVGAGVWLAPGEGPMPAACAGMQFDRIIIGTTRNDVVQGTTGNDLIFGGNGKDAIYGLGGNDCLVADNARDWMLAGGPGDDVLIGNNGKDRLYGGAGDDRLFGERGPDQLYGGSGLDQLFGGLAPDAEEQNGPDDPLPPGPAAQGPKQRSGATTPLVLNPLDPAAAPAPTPAALLTSGATPSAQPKASTTYTPVATAGEEEAP